MVEPPGGVDAEFGPAGADVRAAVAVKAEQTARGVASAHGLFRKNFVTEEEIGIHARRAQEAPHVGFEHGSLHGAGSL